MRKILLALTIAVVLSLAFGGVLVFAANAAAPGDLLYNLDRELEDFLINAAFTSNELPAFLNQNLNTAGVGQAVDDPDDDDVGSAKDGAYCLGEGDKPHPTGDKLAQRYSVSYDEIMGWFCDGGYGFGEIDLGYRISLAKDVPVSEVFDLREQGMGWGNILKEYGLDRPPKPPKPDNGNGNAYGHDKNKDNGNADGNGNAYGHDKNKDKDKDKSNKDKP